MAHRPDGIIRWDDGSAIAIEVELSTKEPQELAENLMELLRGEAYLRLKALYGTQTARIMSQMEQSEYTGIRYYAPLSVRRKVRRARAWLLHQHVISQEEAKRIFVYWYPLAITEAEHRQEEQEDDRALGGE